MSQRICVRNHYRYVTRDSRGKFTSVMKWGKSSRKVGWIKERFERIEDGFVRHLLETCVFDRKGKQPEGITNSLSEAECSLMDDILELKEWLNDMREEEEEEMAEKNRSPEETTGK